MNRANAKARILVADDDPVVLKLLENHVQKAGYATVAAQNGRELIDQVNEDIAAILTDLNMPGADGHECLRHVKKHHADIPVIMISAVGEVKDAVSAMKEGAYDYITKPFDLEEVVNTLRRAVQAGRMSKENAQLKQIVGVSKPRGGFVGSSPATRDLLAKVDKIAPLDATVLMTGESGVGKSLIARMIHYASPRAEQPFVTVSCPALPRDLLESEIFGHEKGAFTGAVQRRIGKIEMAHGGTIFLDEIGDLPLDLQPKFLNVLQDRHFQRIGGSKIIDTDVRVMAATNFSLSEMVRRKEFREDLYYRLNVINIHIPSLRERIEDLEGLCEHIGKRIANGRSVDPYHVSEETMEIFSHYPWPGNVRELENVLERSSAFCDDSTIRPKDLPFEFKKAAQAVEGKEDIGGEGPDPYSSEEMEAADEKAAIAGVPLRELEKKAIIATLKECENNKAKAARQLGITEKSIYNKIKRYEIQV